MYLSVSILLYWPVVTEIYNKHCKVQPSAHHESVYQYATRGPKTTIEIEYSRGTNKSELISHNMQNNFKKYPNTVCHLQ